MSSRCLVALVVLLGAGGVFAEQRASAAKPDVAVRRIEVGAEASVPPVEIHVAPGLSTTVLFDSEIDPGSLEIEGAGRWLRVRGGRDHVVVVPSLDVPEAARLTLTVPFRDTAIPKRVLFTLVVQSNAVERQVEVYRRPRSAESYREEVEQLRFELQQLRAQRESSDGSPVLDGLRALFSLSDKEDIGLLSMKIDARVSCVGSCPFRLFAATSYVSFQRIALRMRLKARGTNPWKAGRAVLLDAQRRSLEVLPVWESRSDAQGMRWLVVEAIARDGAKRGPYTLMLWDVDGARTVTVEDVWFP